MADLSKSLETEFLTPEEAETLRGIVRGSRDARLRTRDVVRLNHLRLIMATGPTQFVPTALGFAWYQRDTENTAMAARKKAARKKAAKRELIATGANKLFVRRNSRGTSFTEVEDAGRSLTQDRRRKAKATAKRGQGDRGDRA